MVGDAPPFEKFYGVGILRMSDFIVENGPGDVAGISGVWQRPAPAFLDANARNQIALEGLRYPGFKIKHPVEDKAVAHELFGRLHARCNRWPAVF